MPLTWDYQGDPFDAVDADGQRYRLTPLYRRRVDADGRSSETRMPNDCVGFRTDAGHDVAGDGAGRYLILGTDPAVVLTSDDPRAVSPSVL